MVSQQINNKQNCQLGARNALVIATVFVLLGEAVLLDQATPREH